jgi:hypothetical protein
MSEYNGTVADLAKDMGQALAAIHKMLSSMQGKTRLDLVPNGWGPDLLAIENVSRRLQGQG